MTTNYQIDGVDTDSLYVKKENFKQSTAWAWGNNSKGQLANNTAGSVSSPVQNITTGSNWKQIVATYSFSGGIKTDGTLWMCGYNTQASLGDNTLANKSSPVQTAALGANWKQLAVGEHHGAAIKTDGTLWLWGYNINGQLGDNTLVRKSSPVQTIAGGTNWKQVAAGYYTTAAIKTDGTLWTWGQGATGVLGSNAVAPRSSPAQTVSATNNWKQVACSPYNDTHMAAIKTDGTLWCWGNNALGQLGDNSITSKSSPVQTVALGTNWKQVACNSAGTAAIKTDGTLWVWGANNFGQLGDNTIDHKSSPVQTIAGGNNWKQVAGGGGTSFRHFAAIKTDGTLWGWGNNQYGQLGDSTSGNSKSSPIQTIAGGNNWKQVSCGYGSTYALKEYV